MPKPPSDYIFCLAVGGVYLYALQRTILSATLIQIDSLTLYAFGLVSLVIFAAVLYNNYTVFVSLGVVVAGAAWIFFTYEDVREQFPQMYEMFQMVTGRMAYQPHLGRMVVWVVSLLMGFTVAVFMLYHFSFYALFAGGVAVFVFTWLPGFSRDERAFLIFLAAFSAILIRKTTQSSAAALAALPLCVAVIFIANANLPQESEIFAPREFGQNLHTGLPVDDIRDFFYGTFNPVHFSFQRTGFSGAGGRLGGPVSPDNRYVMTVYAPGRIYLAGAISNTYTGYRWFSNLSEGDINTHGLSHGQFEMLETAAALIRGATHGDARFVLTPSQFGLLPEDVSRLQPRHFQVLGTTAIQEFELNTYIGRIPEIDYDIMVNTAVFTYSFSVAVMHERDFGYADMTDEQLQEFMFMYHSIHEQATEYVRQIRVGGRFLDYFEIYSTENVQLRRGRYWHTYLPFETLTIRQNTNRTGAVFTPVRAYDLVFAYGSFDYAPYIEITPEGMKQTPRFMRRGTGYYIGFFGVDTQLSFIEQILHDTGRGVYEAQGASQTLDLPTIMRGLPEIEHFVAEGSFILPDMRHRPVTLFNTPLDVQEFAEMLNFYTHPVNHPTPGATNPISYIGNPDHFIRLLNSFSGEILADYAREVREFFLGVPEIVPQRVHDLTADIVAGLDSDFARVSAIRDFLLQFPYTLSPVHVPMGVCFVDFFLFEGQEGYCTYFASAMAIMSRIAGVPSRYVEGFVVPPPSEPGEGVAVTNRMAHAWVEVYLEGFGWHIMEATPTYAFLTDAPRPDHTALTIDPTAFERMQDLMQDFEIPYAPQTDIVLRQPQAEEEEPSPHRHHILYAIFAAVVIFAAIPLIRSARRNLRQMRIQKLPPNAQLIAHFNAITDILSRHKTSPTPGETPLSYGAKYAKRFAFRSDSLFYRDLIDLYYKAKYSPAEISQAEADIMKEAYEDMQMLFN